jgi:hypothetical protein
MNPKALMLFYFIVLSLVGLNFISTTYLKKDYLQGLNKTLKLVLTILILISIIGTISINIMNRKSAIPKTDLQYIYYRRTPDNKNSVIYKNPEGKFFLIDKGELDKALESIPKDFPSRLVDTLQNYFNNKIFLYRFNSMNDLSNSRFFKVGRRTLPLPPDASLEQIEKLNKIYNYMNTNTEFVKKLPQL